MERLRPSSSASRLEDAFETGRERGRIESVFGSNEFFRLWIAQIISATGDWLGFIAITALAIRLGGGNEGASIAFVLTARVAPGLFFATAAGILVDRLNRKRVMLVCDITRALVLFSLPFVDSVLGLVIASFVLEFCTMLWSPAKEAIVPNLVPTNKLTSANSLNVAAAYGMFPVAMALAVLLAKLAESFSDEGWVNTFRLNQEGLAFYVDGFSFLATALIIATISFPKREIDNTESTRKWDLGGTIRELREGWNLIAVNPIVRSVNVGLAVGIMGGGMLIPLGALFVNDVIAGDDADYYAVVAALGCGMALGVIIATVLQNRINRSKIFPWALLLAGSAMFVSASSSFLGIVIPVILVAGFAAGPVYVVGFTLLHEHVEDEIRGRIFSALLVLVRFCLLLALLIGPLLAESLDPISNRLWNADWHLFGYTIAVPGVRLTMWFSALTVVAAGVLASWSLRMARPTPAENELVEPTNAGEHG